MIDVVTIIVGPDGVGKTTCVNIIKHMLKVLGRNCLFVKESYTDSYDEKVSRLNRLQDAIISGCDVIYDRATVVDDLVYSNVITDGSETLSVARCNHLASNCNVVYLTGDINMISSRLGERGDEYISVESLSDIVDSYGETFSEYTGRVWTINVDGKSPLSVANEVLEIILKPNPKLAHIVPVGSLHELDDKQYLMCLAHLVKDNPEYAKYYSQRAADGKSFVLLDNGAAEDSQLPLDDLVDVYKIIRPHEMVIPDTLCDCKSTLDKLSESIAYFDKQGVNCRLMGVPQGKTLAEWTECADAMVANVRVNTIGVSKFLPMATDDMQARIEALKFLDKSMKRHNRYDLQVHLLGLSESPEVVGRLTNRYQYVRGCDTAYGYLCAQAGEDPFVDMDRPKGAIDFVDGQYYDNLSDVLTKLEMACSIYDNRPNDKTWSF